MIQRIMNISYQTSIIQGYQGERCQLLKFCKIDTLHTI